MTTKKRILFVDDEPMVLKGLQRSLLGMRPEWEMDFVESGAQALERMQEKLYDVLVADMVMPHMSGAELADKVMESFPKTIRIILSGHADRNQLIQGIRSTHQFLSKPCDMEVLKAMLKRALVFGESIQNDELKSLVGKLQVLPSLPSLYLQLMELLTNENVSVGEIASTIKKDVGMTSKILQVANSAYFGSQESISSIEESVTHLGSEVLKSLSLTLHVFSELEKMNSKPISFEAMWNQSFCIGAAAKLIAQWEGKSLEFCEQSFVGGMLHSVGKIILASNFPEVYASIYQKSLSEVLGFEKSWLNATHPEIGGYLLGLWGLPLPIVEAVMWYPTPRNGLGREFCPLTTVHVGHQYVLKRNRGNAQEPWAVDRLYLREIGCEDRLSKWEHFLDQHPLFQSSP